MTRALARQGPRRRPRRAALVRRSGDARARSRHRRVRRTDRRRGRSGASARSRRRSRPASRSSPPTRRCSPSTASRSRRSPRSKDVALNFEAAVAGGIPIVKTLREGLAGNTHRAHLRHPQRHLQLHPDPHGAGGPVVRRMPEGGAAARLCRGRPDLRHRRPRHRAEARDPDEPRLRHRGRCRRRSMSRASPRSRRPISRRPTSSATASSCSASRSRPTRASSSACIRPWCRKDSAIAQVMGVTNAVTIDADADRADHAGRPRRRRRWRPRRRWSPTSPTSRAACARRRSAAPTAKLATSARRRRCSATRAATTSACWRVDQPGTAATIAQRLAEQQHFAGIDRAAPSGPRPQGGDKPDKTAGPVPVILITYATTEDAVRRALAAVKRDRVISGAPQVIRIEKN